MFALTIIRRDAPGEAGRGVHHFTIPDEEAEKVRVQMSTRDILYLHFHDSNTNEYFLARDVIREVKLVESK